MANVLDSIPGLGGYLAMQDHQRRSALGDLQGVMGLLSAVRQQQEAQQAAQLAPFRQQMLQAQAQHLQSLAGERAREDAFQSALPELVKGATAQDGSLDWGRLATSLAQTPGGLGPAMKLRDAEQDRAARIQQQEQSLLLRQQQLIDRREESIRRAQNDAERLQAQREYQQGLLGLRAEAIETRRALAAQGGRPPAGYQYNPDGTLAPIPGGPGDKTNDKVDSLRKEFNSLPEVKNYRTTVPIIQSIKSAKDTPAGDLDFIYAVGKILDPDSVVREGEMNLVIKSGSPLERFKGYVNNVMGGGRLTPTIRAQLSQMLNQRVAEIKRGYDAAQTTFKRSAERRGLPTDEIFMDFGALDLPAPASPAGASGGWSIRRKP